VVVIDLRRALGPGVDPASVRTLKSAPLRSPVTRDEEERQG